MVKDEVGEEVYGSDLVRGLHLSCKEQPFCIRDISHMSSLV